MRKITIFLLLIIVVTGCYAQIYSSEECYYIKEGESLEDGSVMLVLFDGDKLIHTSSTIYGVKRQLIKDSQAIYKKLKSIERNYSGNNILNYNSSVSITKRECYMYHNPSSHDFFYNYPEWWWYMGVSPDKSSLIWWRENSLREVTSKDYYIRVDKNEFMPKGTNRDFLYE